MLKRKSLFRLSVVIVLIATFLLSSCFGMAMGEGAFVFAAEDGAEWNYYRYNENNSGVCSYPTPTEMSGTWEKWSVKFGDGVQDATMTGIMTTPTPPIIVNGKLYIGLNKQILEVDKNTGKVLRRSKELPGNVGYAMNPPIYADGKIFVQVSGGRISAVSLSSFEVLWTVQASAGNQMVSPLSYRKINGKGYIYSGSWQGNTKDGVYLAVTTDNSGVKKGIKEAAWEFKKSSEGKKGGFYWAGAYVTDKYIAVGSDDGLEDSTSGSTALGSFYTLSSITGKVISSIDNIKGDIRTTPVYEKGNLYFTTNKGYLYKVPVNANGKLGKAVSIKLAENKTLGSPAVYKGKIYVGVAGGGDIYSTDGGHTLAVVLDEGSKFTKLYSYKVKGFPRAAPLISKAYEGVDYDGNGKADGRIYIYFTYNATPGGVYCIYDEPEWKTRPDAPFDERDMELYIPGEGKKQYCISTISADQSGTLYYRNDSAYMFALEENKALLKNIGVTVSGVSSQTSGAGGAKVGEELYYTPNFDAGISEYAITAKSNVSKITIDLDLGEGTTAKVNGKTYSETSKVSLNLSSESITVPIVVSYGGKSKTYSISVKKAGTDTGLLYIASNLSNAKGMGERPMTPSEINENARAYSFNWLDFDGSQKFYNLWVIPRDAKAKVRVYAEAGANVAREIKGAGNGRYPIYYSDPADNVKVKVEVTSEDGSKVTTYSVTFQRKEAVMLRGSWERIYGQSRYETGFAIGEKYRSLTEGGKFPAVIVATGTNYPDALSGAYLAKVKKAPIILHSSRTEGEVVSYVKAHLKKGGVVYILGGTGVVPDSLVSKLKGIKVKRLGGSNRYETNLKILEEAGVGKEEIIVATGTNYPDALSASSSGRPLLLVGGSIRSDQASFLSKLSKRPYYILGGSAVVSEGIRNEIKKNYATTATRIYGDSRYETSLKIAKKFFPGNQESIIVAYGANFPDALSGGPLAIMLDCPIVMANSTEKVYSQVADYARKAGITRGIVLGGESLVSDEAMDGIMEV